MSDPTQQDDTRTCSPEKLASWRKNHYMVQFTGPADDSLTRWEGDALDDPHCAWCCEDWPCPVSQLLDEVDQLRALKGER